MTHEQVLAAIDKARPHMEGALTLNPALDWRFIQQVIDRLAGWGVL